MTESAVVNPVRVGDRVVSAPPAHPDCTCLAPWWALDCPVHGGEVEQLLKGKQSMNEKPRWYVVNREADNLRLRGPYQHEETADAVRAEMEDRWPDRDWNLAIVFEVDAPAP